MRSNIEFLETNTTYKNIQMKGGKLMMIENIQQTLAFLEDIKNFFPSVEEIEKKLSTELYNKEGERDDLLHEIELSKLNAIEIMSTYKKLETVLKERRCIKDKLDLINTIKPYASKFITKASVQKQIQQ